MGWIIGIVCLLIGVYLGMVMAAHLSLGSKLKNKRPVLQSQGNTQSEVNRDSEDKSDLTG